MFTLRAIRLCARVTPNIVSFKNIKQLRTYFNKTSFLGAKNSLLKSSQRDCTPMCEVSQHDPKDRVVWVDMEMTGLDILKDHILEIACIVTDENLNTIAEGPELTIHHSDHILNSMNEWCIKHHGKSGLTAASRRSKVSTQEAEQQILEFLKLHVPTGACPLAGNSVYMDRLFLRCHMPLVDAHLHYRIIDVSTVKELCRRWCPEKYSKAPAKVYGHRALIDIQESIEELHYYHTAIFQGQRIF